MGKVKMLIMASTFYPQEKAGGPAVSIMNIIVRIKNTFDLFIFSHNHEVNEKEKLSGVKEGWNYLDYGSVYFYNFKEDTIVNILNKIKHVHPDIIYVNSLLSYNYTIPSLIYKKIFNKDVKIIIAPRGELCKNAFALKVLKKKLFVLMLKYVAILKNINWHATSEEEQQDIIKTFNVDKNRISIIGNLSSYVRNEYIKAKKDKGRLRLVSASRIHPKKNTLNALKYLSLARGEIIYDIYGPVEDKKYWKKCLMVIDSLPSNITVKYCGILDNYEVSEMLKNYHVFYLPTLSENYGNAIVEALFNYRPIIISDQTPWTDINSYFGGYAISLNEESRFTQVISELAEMDETTFSKLCMNAGEYIRNKSNQDDMIKKYLEMFS